MSRITNIKLRRGTSASWSAANPVLDAGEVGWDSTVSKFKIGDGTLAWNSLAYVGDADLALKAPLSHVHSGADLTSGTLPDARLPGRLNTVAIDLNVSFSNDWNNAKENGWYMANNGTNAPNTGWFLGVVDAHNTIYQTQTVHAFTSDADTNTQTWRRSNNAGTWQSWYKILLSQTEQDARYQLLIAAGTTAQVWRGDKTWVTADKTLVGLANVDNTSDVNKPVSSATTTQLNLKAPLASPTFTGTVGGVTKTHVGLANVDNTADTAKPVSTAQQTALNLKANLASPTFTGTVGGVTKTHVGLSAVDNTADTAKPVSTAQQTALNLKVNNSAVGAASGVAALDSSGKVPSAQLPLATVAWVASTSYTAGQQVVSPDGDILTALSTHTSPSVFDAKDWTGKYGYLVANFGNNDPAYEKLSVNYSNDGKYVVAGINNPVHSPTSGVRDPSVIEFNGVWYVAYTVNNGYDKTLGVSSSTDLVNWTTPTIISVSAATSLAQAWAPEWAIDTDGTTVRLFFTNVTTAPVLETWYITATNGALTTWSAPVKINWTANPGNVIDPFSIYEGGTWTHFYGVDGYIHRATSSTLTGTWTQQNSGDWASWRANAPDANTNYEAPQVVKLAPNLFRIYLDRYVGASGPYTFKGYIYSEATSLSGTWSTPIACNTSPGYPGGQVLRHGSWIKLNSTYDQQLVRAATVEGMPPVRHAEVTASNNVTGGQHWNGAFTLDGPLSKRSGDFMSIPANRQIKILVEGVYTFDWLAVSTINLGGGWMAIKGPSETPIHATNDIMNGAPAWNVVLSNIYVLAGTIFEFYFFPGATQTSAQLSLRARVTKVQ
jgi:hypothetical protein